MKEKRIRTFYGATDDFNFHPPVNYRKVMIKTQQQKLKPTMVPQTTRRSSTHQVAMTMTHTPSTPDPSQRSKSSRARPRNTMAHLPTPKENAAPQVLSTSRRLGEI